jgi:putative cardiolipin synthase
MQTSLEETVPQYAYAVTLDQQQRLQWQDPESGSLSRKEPQAGFWKRVAAKLLSFLPIEGLL